MTGFGHLLAPPQPPASSTHASAAPAPNRIVPRSPPPHDAGRRRAEQEGSQRASRHAGKRPGGGTNRPGPGRRFRGNDASGGGILKFAATPTSDVEGMTDGPGITTDRSRRCAGGRSDL